MESGRSEMGVKDKHEGNIRRTNIKETYEEQT
jgi:hypothetical protein